MSIAIRRNVRRAGAALMAAVVAAALCLNAAMPAHADDKQKELENKKNELQSELDQIRQQLKDVASDKAEAEQQKQLLVQEKNTIKGQINALNDQIDDISAQIVEKEQQITDKQAEIDQKQAEYDDRWAKYKEQVVSMQMLDQGGGIALLSTAENIYQLLTFDQVLQDISDANTQACEDLEQQGIELTNERTQLEEAKASLEADEEELQNQKSQLDSKTQELASNIQAQDASISAAAAQEQALEEAKSDKQAEFDKAADEYDAYLKSLIAQTQRNYANAPISCSLNFICPLPSYKYISCQYGSGGHKGVDFAAPGRHQHPRCGKRRCHRVRLALQLWQLCHDLPRHRRPGQHLCYPVRPHEQHPAGQCGPERFAGGCHRLCWHHRQLHRQPPAPGTACERCAHQPAELCSALMLWCS